MTAAQFQTLEPASADELLFAPVSRRWPNGESRWRTRVRSPTASRSTSSRRSSCCGSGCPAELVLPILGYECG